MSTEQNKGLPTAHSPRFGAVRYSWVLAPLGLNPAAQRIPVMGRFGSGQRLLGNESSEKGSMYSYV